MMKNTLKQNHKMGKGNKMNYRFFIPGLLLISSAGALADGVPMTPGKWEMKTTMEMSMFPAPQVRTFTECIEETELKPENFNMEEDSPCDMADIEIDGNTVRWSISCPGAMGNMTGNWEFTSAGDSVIGTGSMSADMGGMAMEMKMNWEGERLGDCE
jgi:hypothetical protein